MRWIVGVVAACGSPVAPPDAPAGTLDPTFGRFGKVTVPVPGLALAVAADADGILAVASTTDGKVATVRISPVGAIEAMVDTGVVAPIGVASGGTTPVSGGFAIATFDQLITCDGSGALTGTLRAPNNEAWHAARAGLIACGTFDAGTPTPVIEHVDIATGIDVATRFEGGFGTVFDCAVDATGVAYIGRDGTRAMFGRVDLAGHETVPTVVVRDNADARALAIDGSGYIVSGVIDGELGVMRVGADGTLDPGFGSAGVVTTPIGSDPGNAFAVAVTGDRIVAAGSTSIAGNPAGSSGGIVRYDASGRLDPSFGVVAFDPGTRVFAMTIAPDGKIVVAGDTFATDGTESVFVARVLP
jgi:hypothetical protein